ncbi:F-box/LRR-repeat protein At3g58900-like [Solanum stenotomum]|uniref:F-box/LRR-repeat protein At3g58900-like n=1 Tax=Solanum stenotomum TaxID=172797 RepID=UPI0020D0B4D8|nr:F-box/LRR-repeat protein At3g58900-like [Solanum stenotomum]
MAKRHQLSNNFALKKCSAEDHISKLPDEILVHILSFLTVKEAADTSVLSKRWLPLWTYIYRLDFNATKPLNEVALNPKRRKMYMKKYIRWVSRTLKMCKVERLDQFRISFDLNKFAQHKIDRWLEFAVARQVQRLELDLLDGGDLPQYSGSCYNFPVQHFGLNDYDYSAQPRLNKLPPLLHNFFKSLKVLLFKSVNLTGEVVEFFIYNCPSLEELTVHASETLVNLQVVGPSVKLKYLSIWYCIALKSLKICDTNLVTLSTTLSAARLVLVNVPMLIELHALGFPTNILDAMLSGISSCLLSQLEVLKINSDITIFGKHCEYGLVYLGKYKIPQLTMLKKFVLVLEAWEDRTFLDCTNVIEAAPQLTEFELNNLTALWYAGFPPEWNPDSGISFVLLLLSLVWIKPKRSKRECRKVARCPLHHLKVLKLYGYYGRTSELELVRYFLENAIVLEKILVDPIPLAFFRIEGEPRESKPVRIARKYAKLQLEREVPSHIELVIL